MQFHHAAKTLAFIVNTQLNLTGSIMNIKFCIVGVAIALPILFSDVVFADPIVAPFWSGNMMDDFKRPNPAPVTTADQKNPNKPLPAKKSADVTTSINGPFWSGNAIATK